jgi:putative sporulation protein YtaF
MDGLGVGVAYGLQKIKVPVFSRLIISTASFCAICVAIFASSFVAKLLSVDWARFIGAAILITIGIWLILQVWVSKENGKAEGGKLFEITIRPLGLIIQILRQPRDADMDHSGVISPQEAVALGMALALDAIGVGFGAVLAAEIPVSLLAPFVVGLNKFLFLSLGIFLGSRTFPAWYGKKIEIIPGGILILMGIIKFF